MRRSGSAGKSSRPSRSSASRERSRGSRDSYVICIRNEGYPVSLELGKVYRSLGQPEVGPKGYIAVVDESGEDYLYPESFFHAIDLPQEVEEALTHVGPARH